MLFGNIQEAKIGKKLCVFRNNISFAPNTLKFNPITPIAMKKLLALAVLLMAFTVSFAQPAHLTSSPKKQ